ncbi:enoyl-CoA hydratase/isomerase family protein [Catellatospora coxensis]|uniref:Enoyl-CoA hydratase n=1 Tax=Catellatospora coxensis TaxID=310354 RepID=A0A8J3P9U0_9ACTN|nr:enoyl-CoA hydratase/isomerase family protein [Catellatospora coxensis]GIG07136.1 enoyl-CoA hydratase [Catellatospora coxensis]
MDAGTGHVTVRRGPAHVRAVLTRPAEGNTLTPGLIASLSEALDEAERTPDCRLFVLTAEGGSFCEGLDLADDDLVRRWDDAVAEQFHTLITRLRNSPLVTVALVGGPAAGGGVGLAVSCDLVYASPKASFRLTEVLLGLSPAMILPNIARRVGETLAFRLALLAEEVRAEDADRIGLVDAVTDDLDIMVRRTLTALGRMDPATIAQLKATRGLLFADEPRYSEYAKQLLGRRLGDPFVRNRIDRLRAEGLLR